MPCHSLRDLNTLQLEVNAQHYVAITSLRQLRELLPCSEPTLILGGGSNVLFTQDYEGMLLHNQLRGIEITECEDYYHLSVAGGENWHDLVIYCAEQGIGGLENLALIPGTVGAAPVQNIGAYGVELSDVCRAVEAFSLTSAERKTFSSEQCQFGYRDSVFKVERDWFISRVDFKLAKHWRPQLGYGELQRWGQQLGLDLKPLDVAKQVIAIRQSKLPNPKVTPNVGSFFKNPVVDKAIASALLSQYPTMPSYPAGTQTKLAAGWLIDQVGLKGFTVGGAAVHQRQALVLINQFQATATDIVQLAHIVRNKVEQQFNVRLEPEVNFIAQLGYSNLDEVLSDV
ncbi:UDP-N-acetylmuramate dehydrogenase [Psychrobium sp. 1_MG-2023]|uniref:UDP-N-acetylmuramate dehydrogenase n=1 Tax=Psychrobium sp. 1_MG-2023 TaxID=3062624 RepID=UPI000C34B73F|nr:UDP-N-acetylmuramate dehydrogenase [Psychrobium sp. 1_MG-2023]MDP2562550.1 UDP-N-acetylmuramate dehydrogenase [Psychrobium sp. 1_MG-2023]PKF54430.1 UDP-N-acetylenolpyruvoylglucosamine reductase [Alteromonadales bacterium alter-6D02]